MLRYAYAEPAHVRSLLPHLRDEDARELVSSTGKTPEEALLTALDLSGYRLVALGEDGEVVVLFGLASANDTIGVPWMVASKSIRRHARDVARASRDFADEMNSLYPLLMNAADSRNTLHLRWLEWAGFTLGATTTDHGKDGTAFINFHRTRTHV